MDRWTATIKESYRYLEIQDETEKSLRLLVETDRGPMSVPLPKKCIRHYPADKQVVVPRWLCIKTGLIRPERRDHGL